MAINLTKGGNVSLTKEAPRLTKINVGLGWGERVTDGSAFDLDVSVIPVKEDDKVRDDGDFCFYNNKSVLNGAIVHGGDNVTGKGTGDDEVIAVDLSSIPLEITRVIFIVTVYDAITRNQNFGMVNKAFIRVCNGIDNTEITRYDLCEDASLSTAMIFGELYRNGTDWKFKAIGEGRSDGLSALASSFGVIV
jgi:tellurium resistance protein TerD